MIRYRHDDRPDGDWNSSYSSSFVNHTKVVVKPRPKKAIKKDIFKEAVDIWGIDSQVSMAIEEMAELIVELNKYFFRNNKKRKQKLFEELADVELMLAQLRYILADTHAIDEHKNAKIERLKKRLVKAEKARDRALY